MTFGNGLKRIARLYAMVENLHGIQVKAAAVAVDEATQAKASLEAAKQSDVRKARACLEQGSRVEALAGERTSAALQALQQRLEQACADRVKAHRAAADLHRESRVELRQLEKMLERKSALDRAAEDRRTQAASDDRYLSRREWLFARAEKR